MQPLGLKFLLWAVATAVCGTCYTKKNSTLLTLTLVRIRKKALESYEKIK
jgi:hypothetical protein